MLSNEERKTDLSEAIKSSENKLPEAFKPGEELGKLFYGGVTHGREFGKVIERSAKPLRKDGG